MSKTLTFFILLLNVMSIVKGYSYPEKWERCKMPKSPNFERNKCIEKTMEKIIIDLAVNNGSKELGLKTLNPFYMEKMYLSQNNRAANIVVEFKDMNLYGFEKIQVTRAMVKMSTPENWRLRYSTTVPLITLLSNYSMKGNLLIFPIVGSGDCNITLFNPEYVHEVSGVSKTVDGKKYLKVTNHTLDITVTKLNMIMNNLFNGNKALGDNMNKVLNENWMILYEEMKPICENQMGRSFTKYIKKALERIEYKDLFLNESA